MIDIQELLKRALKYIVEGIMVALAAYAIPKKSVNLRLSTKSLFSIQVLLRAIY